MSVTIADSQITEKPPTQIGKILRVFPVDVFEALLLNKDSNNEYTLKYNEFNGTLGFQCEYQNFYLSFYSGTDNKWDLEIENQGYKNPNGEYVELLLSTLQKAECISAITKEYYRITNEHTPEQEFEGVVDLYNENGVSQGYLHAG